MDIEPLIVIDTREQEPLRFEHLTAITATLTSGDYSVAGLENLFAVERKTVADIVGSVTSGRERFERELLRLRGYRFKRLLIIGSAEEIDKHVKHIKKRYKSKANAACVVASLRAFEHRYDVPVVWAGSATEAAEMIEVWAFYAAREVLKNSAALQNATKKGQAGAYARKE